MWKFMAGVCEGTVAVLRGGPFLMTPADATAAFGGFTPSENVS